MAHPLPELVSYLEGLPEPHILFDRQYRILAANAAYRRQFSPERSVVGRTCYEVSHHFQVPCDQAGESCPLVKAHESGQRERVLHLHGMGFDGLVVGADYRLCYRITTTAGRRLREYCVLPVRE